MKNYLFVVIFATLSIVSCSQSKKEDSTQNKSTESTKNEAIKKIDYYAENAGAWMDIVKAEIAANRKPVLFFTATWCGPCKEFKNSLTDPLMIEALNNITLIMIDADIDAEKEKIGDKYEISGYPSFVRVDAEGEVLDEADGGEWDENIPVNMAPVLKAFMGN